MTDRTLWTRVHSVLLTFVMVATLLAAPPPEIARAATLLVDNAPVANCENGPGTPYCTIQAAYDAASPGDTIQVAAGTYPEELVVNKNNLTIAGAGAGVTIITAAATGAGQHQIIDNNGHTLTISGVTITGGNTDNFGTIYTSTGNLTIQDSVITGNTIGSQGGAVYNNGPGVLNLVRTTVSANTAGGDGGGIYNTDGASLNVIDSIIDGNQANNGGGIFHRSNAGNLSISGSAIVGNTATVSGGGVYTDAGVNTIVNTTVSGNTATPPGGGVGGGIAALSNAALTVTVNNVTISGNTASVGGGVYSNTATSPVAMANSIAFGNSASGTTADCNGAVDVEGPVIIGTYNCSTNLSGSGSVSSSDPLLDPLTTLGATTTHHPLGTGSPAIDAGNPVPVGAYPACEAVDQLGTTRPLGSACDLGAVEAPVATLQDLINANPGTVIVVPPGTYTETITIGGGTTLQGGGATPADVVIDAQGAGRAVTLTAGDASFENLTITGGVSANQGGGIHVDGAGHTVNLTDVVVENNDSTLDGAGIWVDTGNTLNIVDSRLSNNVSQTNGGAIYSNGATVNLTNSFISNNRADNTGSGAGLFANGGVLNLNGTGVDGNIAQGDGGGARLINGADLQAADSWFTANTATGAGGGLAFLSSTGFINRSLIAINDGAIGGGVDVDGDGDATPTTNEVSLRNSTVSGNVGGGVVTSGVPETGGADVADVHLYFVTVTENTGAGGVKSGAPNTVTLARSLVAGNTDTVGDRDCEGSIGMAAFNLIGIADVFCDLVSQGTGDIVGSLASPVDPLLDSLANNGGPTLTHALLPGSPAIDGAITLACLSVDQRGVTRPQGVQCDIGAFELEASPVGYIQGLVNAAADGAVVDIPAGTYLENVVIAKNLTLRGAGADQTTIDAGASGAAIEIDGAFAVNVESMTLTNGTGATTDSCECDAGGALNAADGSTVVLVGVEATNSTADRGAGIYTEGDLTVRQSTISGNSATDIFTTGGGIHASGASNIIKVINSTVSGNNTSGRGGGIASQGATVSVNHSTLVGNTAGVAGGAVYADTPGQISVRNSLLSGNSAPAGTDCATAISLGYNVFGPSGSCPTLPTDVQTGSPGIEPLTFNGGPTRTHALQAGSPAIDSAAPDDLEIELVDAIDQSQLLIPAAMPPTPASATTIVGNSLVLTPSVNWQVGTVWAASSSESAFDLTQGFSTTFDFQISEPFDTDTDGAGGDLAFGSGDGIAFAISPSSTYVGEPGGRLGIAAATEPGIVSVSFKTYAGNIAGINVGGQSDGQGVVSDVSTTIPGAFDDGSIWTVWVDYDAATDILEARISSDGIRPEVAQLSHTVNIAAEVGPTGYYGFGSATASAFATHTITAWELYSVTCPPTDQRGVARPQGAACDSGAFELAELPTVELSLSAPATVEPGAKVVPVTNLPSSLATGVTNPSDPTDDNVASAPIAGLDTQSAPIESSPIAGLPIAGLPIAGLPIAGLSTAAQEVLNDILLSDVPITGGWGIHLAESEALSNRPIQSVTYGDAMQDADVLASLASTGLTFDDMNVSSTPIAGLPIAGLALGNLPIAGLPIAGLGATPTQNLQAWCDLLDGQTVNCTTLGITPSSGSSVGLLDVTVAGGDISSAPIAGLPIAGLPIAGLPIAGLPIAGLVLADSPIAGLPIAGLPIAGLPIAGLPIAGLPIAGLPIAGLEPKGTPIAGLPIAGLYYSGDGGVTSAPIAGLPIAGLPIAGLPIAGLPIAGLPIAGLPIAGLKLADAPIAGLPIAGLDVSGAPIAGLPIAGLPIAGLPIAGLPIAGLYVNGAPIAGLPIAGLPIAGLPIAGLPIAGLPIAGLCTSNASFDCNGAGTVLQAHTAGALSGNLGDWARILTIGDLLGLSVKNATGQPYALDDFFNQFVVDGTTLGELLAGGGFPPTITATTSLVDLAGYLNMTVGELMLFLIDGGLGAELGTVEDWIGILTIQDLLDLDVRNSSGALLTIADFETAFAGLFLGDLVDGDDFPVTGQTTLADLSEYLGMTLGQLLQAMIDGGIGDEYFLGDLLLLLVNPADYPWEDLDLATLSLQDFATGGATTTYTGSISLDNGAGLPGTYTLTLPPGFLYRSATVTNDGAVDHTVFTSGPNVIVTIPSMPGGTTTVEVVAASSLALGIKAASATVSIAGIVETANAALTVGQANEPNDTPATATNVAEDTVYVSHIATEGDVDLFKLAGVVQGSRLSLILSDMTEDFDLVLYGPKLPQLRGEPDATATGVSDPGSFVDGNDQLQAENAGDVPLVTFPGNAQFPGGTHTVVATSTQRNASDELITTQPLPIGGDYYVQVTGYNGATSVDPYLLRAEEIEPLPSLTCQPRSIGTGGATGTEFTAGPGPYNTLVLFNQKRYSNTYGASAAGDVRTALEGLVGENALGVNGIIAPLDGVNYGDWDANRCDPLEANDVVNSIGTIVDNYRTANPSIEYVVIVGGDDQVPFARVQDHTQLSNEREYATSVSSENNELFGSLITGFLLTDDPYGDPNPTLIQNERLLYTSEIAIGRLVESPSDILTAIGNFTRFNGRLDPGTSSSSLSTGYDFIEDAANAVDLALETDPRRSGATLNTIGGTGNLWTSDQLTDAIFGIDPDVLSLGAHMAHDALLSALEDTAGTQSDLWTPTDATGLASQFDGTIVFSMGCHSAFSANDVQIGQTKPDFASTFTALGAAYVGETGFGYGETEIVALGEELMRQFALRLNGSMTIGQAMLYAKQFHAAQNSSFGAYDEKVVMETVMYGLPFYAVGDIAALPAPPTTLPTGVDGATGLTIVTASIDTVNDGVVNGVEFDRNIGERGDFFSANGKVQVSPFQPIQPKATVDVTQSGLRPTDVLITELTSEDIANFEPSFSRPIVDSTENEPEISLPGTFPLILPGVNRYIDINGDRANLVVVLGQYTSGATASVGTERLFTHVKAQVHFDTNGDIFRPAIASANANDNGTLLNFTTKALDNEGSIKRVLVLYKVVGVDGSWTPLDLVETVAAGPGGTSSWSASVPSPSTASFVEVEYVVQAVDENGNVAVHYNKRAGHQSVQQPPPPPPPAGITIELEGGGTIPPINSGSVSIVINGPIPADTTYRLDEGPVTPYTSGLVVTVTGDRLHRFTANIGGQTTYVEFVIDTTGPTIFLTSPADGQLIEVGSGAVADFSCSDAGVGVADCTATLDGDAIADGDMIADGTTVAAGGHDFEVTSTDNLGNSATPFSATFKVADPVEVAPVVTNVVALGTAVEMAATFTGGPDAHTLTWTWGDGTADTACTSTGGAACPTHDDVIGTSSASHTYSDVGVYTVTATVSHDGFSPAQTSVYQYVVVYDPSGAFVTGGGWFWNPAGSYTPNDSTDPVIVGKAKFGFNTKYKKGSTVPQGKTSFELKAAQLDFSSNSYDWLVVSSAKAQFEGQGTIAGMPGTYRFKVTLRDADVNQNDSHEVDGFRIVIWSNSGGGVIYDNGRGVGDQDEFGGTTEIDGGSIVIHVPKGKK